MNETNHLRCCPECGLELTETAGGSCCTACLLRLAIDDDATTANRPEINLPQGFKSRFFGDYEILEEIARGGMGVVYKARQLSLKRIVALKMIQANHLLSAEARLRFGVEIEAVAHLNHPHIVALHESGEYEGTHFFTMKFVEGGNLSDRFRARTPVRDMVRLLIKVCRAVHYAHQRGILHRDLKPSNILLDEQREPHVVDFGLAKSIDQESGFTFTSSILGSPNYMAPEQASTRSGQLTTAVDVYGLGAILYEALAGRPPFQAPTALETIRQVVDTEPVAPRKFNPGVDADLEVICLKCLAKEPTARYGTAEDLARDLERWLEGKPILARPLSTLAVAWRWTRRHPAVASLALALILALVAIGVGVSYAAVQINQAERRATANLRKSLVSEARVLRLGGNLGNREAGLDLIREAVDLGGPPDFLWKARNELAALLARTDMKFVDLPNAGFSPDPRLSLIDPKFGRIVTMDQSTNLLVLSAKDGTVLQRLASLDHPILRLERFSPEGRFFATRHADGVGVWDLHTGQRCLFRPGTNQMFYFTAHVRRLALQEEPYHIVFYRLPTGEVMGNLQLDPTRWEARESGWTVMAVSPNGKMLAASTGPGHYVEIIKPQTGEILHNIGLATPTTALAWSQDNEELAVATLDGKITIWDAEANRLKPSFPPMLPPAHHLAFDPSNQWLAAAGGDSRVQFFDLSETRLSFEFRAEGGAMTFDPTGERLGLLFMGDRWGWLEAVAPTAFREFSLEEGSGNPLNCLFSADGSVLASGNLTNIVFNDITTGGSLGNYRGARITAAAFDPMDSTLLLAGTPGLFRLAPRINSRGRLSFGNGEFIQRGRGWRAFSFSQGGHWFAAANIHSNAAFVFDRTLTNVVARLGPHPETDAIAISPDGRWVTTGSYLDQSMLVWNVAEEKVEKPLRVGQMPRATFSGDGRWLATFGNVLELRETGTWKLAPPLPFLEGRPVLGAPAFSPDGRILAVVADHSTIHLIDLQRFQSLAILHPPTTVNLSGLNFSPDGTFLAAVGEENRAMVWNLRELRHGLAQLDLDWDLPPLPWKASPRIPSLPRGDLER